MPDGIPHSRVFCAAASTSASFVWGLVGLALLQMSMGGTICNGKTVSDKQMRSKPALLLSSIWFGLFHNNSVLGCCIWHMLENGDFWAPILWIPFLQCFVQNDRVLLNANLTTGHLFCCMWLFETSAKQKWKNYKTELCWTRRTVWSYIKVVYNIPRHIQ